jgi:hypothetical protein
MADKTTPIRQEFEAVRSAELQWIMERRGVGPKPAAKGDREALANGLVGLAISGGGIRSATLGLGVLEALKELGLLKKLDYLSTVSGGGYIGGWLSANCRNAAKRGIDWLAEEASWRVSISHLRRYSNYLSPRVGLFSADTWTMGVVWLRNTLLIQSTVVLGIAVLLMLPRLFGTLFRIWPDVGVGSWFTVVSFLVAVVGVSGNLLTLNWPEFPLLHRRNWPFGLAGAVASLALAGGVAVQGGFDSLFSASGAPALGLASLLWPVAPVAGLLLLAGFCFQPVAIQVVNSCWVSETGDKPERINFTQSWTQKVVVIPIMATAFFTVSILWDFSAVYSDAQTVPGFGDLFATAWKQWPFPVWVMFVSLWLLCFCSVKSCRSDWRIIAGAPAVAALVLHASLCLLLMLLAHFRTAMYAAEGHWHALVWGPPLLLVFYSWAVLALIGIQGRQALEGVREWWSRMGAWLLIYGFAWMVFMVAAVYGPIWSAQALGSDVWAGVGAGGWLATTVAGIVAGKSEFTDGGAGRSGRGKAVEAVAKLAPFVFIAGLLVGIATAIQMVVWNLGADPYFPFCDLRPLRSGSYWYVLDHGPEALDLGGLYVPFELPLLLALAVVVFLLAARVDINEFSFNAFYRNRLVRCYLGAARYRADGGSERLPQHFTGFDDGDDLPLAFLSARRDGPLHIINCSVNLGGSSDLAVHTRHSAIFTMTPLHCGSPYLCRHPAGGPDQQIGYIPTSEFGGSANQPTLGQAIAVSGAAASPNMGYHTSPVVAFLMTLFNVRLGWWFPNPRFASSIGSPSPRFSLRYLLRELFGAANEKAPFLAISDGGHFENLAAIELLRRRCRVIIVSDGECDPGLRFEGLGSLIRMAAVDLHADIKIDVSSLRAKSETQWSDNRCAVGSIRYDDGTVGYLIYLKAAMTGHEDTAVMQYKSTHPAFPHESTGDQFYGEDQFESYRRLGKDMAMRAFNPVRRKVDARTRCYTAATREDRPMVELARQLYEIHSPGMPGINEFTERTAQLMDLWKRLGDSEELACLDTELGRYRPELVTGYSRSAFYLCSELIQLMEDVYLDLNLEQTWEHPDNSGWRSLFIQWAESALLKTNWELTQETYGLRFRYFCDRNLGLKARKGSDEPGAGIAAETP